MRVFFNTVNEQDSNARQQIQDTYGFNIRDYDPSTWFEWVLDQTKFIMLALGITTIIVKTKVVTVPVAIASRLKFAPPLHSSAAKALNRLAKLFGAASATGTALTSLSKGNVATAVATVIFGVLGYKGISLSNWVVKKTVGTSAIRAIRRFTPSSQYVVQVFVVRLAALASSKAVSSGEEKWITGWVKDLLGLEDNPLSTSPNNLKITPEEIHEEMLHILSSFAETLREVAENRRFRHIRGRITPEVLADFFDLRIAETEGVSTTQIEV